MASQPPIAPRPALTTGSELPRIRAIGRPFAPHLDLYHFLLTLSWLRFFGVVALAWLALNALFAVFYYMIPNSLADGKSETLESCFFFSVQTLATIGYGTISPGNRVGNVLVVLESLTGILSVALITGLTFARFARPRARVVFTNKLVILHRDGGPQMLLRVANARHNQIVDAQMRVMVLTSTRTSDGQEMRVPVDLPLVREKTSMFFLSWTLAHRIDESSPFHGPGALERLRAQQAQVFCTLIGIDETIAQAIHVRYIYNIDDIVYDHRFSDVLSMRPDGTRILDYNQFHRLEPVPSTVPRVGP